MRSPLVFPAASAVLSLVSASGCSGTETSSPAAAPPTADAPQVPEGDAGALGPGDATPAPDPGTKGCAIAPKGAGTFAARTLTAAGMPVWMTHDKNDDALPVADARSSRDIWAAENGCKTATWSAVSGRPECQRNRSCPASEPLVYCETSGVGHDVPGFAVDEIGTFFSGLLK